MQKPVVAPNPLRLVTSLLDDLDGFMQLQASLLGGLTNGRSLWTKNGKE
jgi:hypothetical protein